MYTFTIVGAETQSPNTRHTLRLTGDTLPYLGNVRIEFDGKILITGSQESFSTFCDAVRDKPLRLWRDIQEDTQLQLTVNVPDELHTYHTNIIKGCTLTYEWILPKFFPSSSPTWQETLSDEIIINPTSTEGRVPLMYFLSATTPIQPLQTLVNAGMVYSLDIVCDGETLSRNFLPLSRTTLTPTLSHADRDLYGELIGFERERLTARFGPPS